MGFEVFEKGSAPLPTIPSVTIQKRGLFSLNDAAQSMLKSPEAIQFLWDSERRVIGLRGVELDAPNAYPARHQATPSGRAGRGPVLVAGTLFTKYIGLDTTSARRWVPRLEGDILVIDLNEPGQPVVANRNRKQEQEKKQAEA